MGDVFVVDDFRKLKRKRRFVRVFSFALPLIIIVALLAEAGSHAIRVEGLSTIATVTSVEWQENVNDRAGEGRFQTTFEYIVDGERITSTRTSGTTSSRVPPWRVGAEVRIYYSSQRPSSFVFADGGSFGFAYWLFIGGMTVAWFFAMRENWKVRKEIRHHKHATL